MNISRKSIRKRSAAFTLLEGLISLLITSIVSCTIFVCFHTSINLIQFSKNNSKSFNHILRFDEDIRNAINKTSIPFYESELTLMISDNYIEIKEINNPNCYLCYSFPEFIQIISIDFIVSESRKPIGLAIEYSYQDKTFMCKEIFSSFMVGAIRI